MAAGVIADRQVGEPVGRGDAAVEGAGAFGGFGGVLGHVARDLGVGHVAMAVTGRMSSWRPQASVRAGSLGAAGVVDADGAGGLVDGGGEQGEGGPGWAGRRLARRGRRGG